MKYLKLFETLSSTRKYYWLLPTEDRLFVKSLLEIGMPITEELKVGDLVIANLDLDRSIYGYFIDFIANNIGEITDIRDDKTIYAAYDNVPKSLQTKFLFDTDLKKYITGIFYDGDNKTSIRLATPEEIRKNTVRKNIKPYNL